jgi:translation initiation factor 2 beta subunit (eIF-2beta)/eIF-5
MNINLNGNQIDKSNRYTMPSCQVKKGGFGNGVYTIFDMDNIKKVCKSFNHPYPIVLKYIATITGSNLILDKLTITGAHDSDKINELIINYVKYFVTCPVCSIPETIPILFGNKKNTEIKLKCSACKNESSVKNTNKHIDKGIDIITKYLKSGNEWLISKNMVSKNTVSKNMVSKNTVSSTDNTVSSLENTVSSTDNNDEESNVDQIDSSNPFSIDDI